MTLYIPCYSKNFIKITLSHTVSEINAFYVFYAEFQDCHQNWLENDFWHKVPDDCTEPRMGHRTVFLALFNLVPTRLEVVPTS